MESLNKDSAETAKELAKYMTAQSPIISEDPSAAKCISKMEAEESSEIINNKRKENQATAVKRKFDSTNKERNLSNRKNQDLKGRNEEI